MNKRVLVVLAALLLIGGSIGLARRLHVTDAERVQAAWEELVDAVEAEAPGRVAGVLGPGLRYDGPRPVGQGDHDGAMAALSGFWSQADRITVTTRTNEVTVRGAVATSLASTLLRFSYGGSIALYQVRLQVSWVRRDGAWRAQDVHVLSLTPGLFGG